MNQNACAAQECIGDLQMTLRGNPDLVLSLMQAQQDAIEHFHLATQLHFSNWDGARKRLLTAILMQPTVPPGAIVSKNCQATRSAAAWAWQQCTGGPL